MMISSKPKFAFKRSFASDARQFRLFPHDDDVPPLLLRAAASANGAGDDDDDDDDGTRTARVVETPTNDALIVAVVFVCSSFP